MIGWEYKVTFNSKNVPEAFKDWALSNKRHLKIGPVFLEELTQSNRYLNLSGLYFYVKSEKILTLVQLLVGSCISRVDKITIENKNT